MKDQQSNTISEIEAKQLLLESIVNVMAEVEYLQKDDTVGTGSNSYKGISDEKVKLTLRKSMITHGLICVPIAIETETKQERWTEADPYSKTGGTKTKQQIFSDIKFTFRIYHISGAYIEGQSTGHGVDSQDKAAGKAMTYAMKYFLLNTFMIPTGDDTDKTHSNDIEIPKKVVPEVTKVEEKTEKVVEKKPVESEKVGPKFPSEEELKKLLYNGTGILSFDISKGVIENWKKAGAALLYGKYIYTFKEKKFIYFIVDENQMNLISKDIKFRHG